MGSQGHAYSAAAASPPSSSFPRPRPAASVVATVASDSHDSVRGVAVSIEQTLHDRSRIQDPRRVAVQCRDRSQDVQSSSSPSYSPLSQVRNVHSVPQVDRPRQIPPVPASLLDERRSCARSAATHTSGIDSSEQGDPQRSRSLKSQFSEGAYTDRGYSSSGRESLAFETTSRETSRSDRTAQLARDGRESTVSSLGRSGSSASTVPTSPGHDVAPYMGRPKKAPTEDTRSVVAQVAEPHVCLPAQSRQGMNAATVNGKTSVSLRAGLPSGNSNTPTGHWNALPTIYSMGDMSQPEPYAALANVAPVSPASHRNKPLPSPGSRATTWSPSERDGSDSASVAASSRPPSRTSLRSAISQGTRFLMRGSAGTKKMNTSNEPDDLPLETSTSSGMSATQQSVGATQPEPQPSSSTFLFRRKSKSNLKTTAGKSATPSLPLKKTQVRTEVSSLLLLSQSSSGRTSGANSHASTWVASPGQKLPISATGHCSDRAGLSATSLKCAYSERESSSSLPADGKGALIRQDSASSLTRLSLLHYRLKSMSELRSSTEATEAIKTSPPAGPKSDKSVQSKDIPGIGAELMPRSRHSRWSQIMGKSDDSSNLTRSVRADREAYIPTARPCSSLATYDGQGLITSSKSSKSEVRSLKSTLSGADSASLLRRSPIPSVASSAGSRTKATIRKGTRQSIVEGTRARKTLEAVGVQGSMDVKLADSRHSLNATFDAGGRPLSPLSPATISSWSSAVASELNLDASGEGRQEPDHDRDIRAGRHQRSGKSTESTTDVLSSYHDALSSQDASEPSGSGSSSVCKRSEAHSGPTSSLAVARSPQTSKSRSSRNSLGRTLSTMFDPRPNLEGRIPTSRLPGTYVQASSDSGQSRVPGQRKIPDPSNAARNLPNTSHYSDVSTERLLQADTSDRDSKRKSIADGVTRVLMVNQDCGGRASTHSSRRPRSASLDASSDQLVDSASVAIGSRATSPTVSSRLRAVEGAKQQARLATASLPPPAVPIKGAARTSEPMDRQTSLPPLDTQQSSIATTSSALSRLRKRSLTSLSSVRSASGSGSITKLSALTSTAGSIARETKRQESGGRFVKSNGSSAQSELSAKEKMTRSASAIDLYGHTPRGPGTEERPHFVKYGRSQQMKEIDDRAFLNLLETARREHKEQAAKQISTEAKGGVGEVESNHDENRTDASTREPISTSSRSTGQGRHLPRPTLHRRISSAGGRLGGEQALPTGQDALASHAETASPQASLSASALISNVRLFEVGNASGKATDVFNNDDEWKREVRALFVIREVLNTEQSYARHLEALLTAVRTKATSTFNSPGPSHSRRKSSTGLLGTDLSLTASATHATRPSHIAASERYLPLMKNLLPQLIALSRSLAARIDANPTAAGVASAFLAVAPQLEATFVAWSSAAQEIMKSLSITQGPKSKLKDRLLLAPTVDTDSSVFKVSAVQDASSGDGSPSTPPRDPIRSTSYAVPSDTEKVTQRSKHRSFSTGQVSLSLSPRAMRIRTTSDSMASTVGEVGIASSPLDVDDNCFLDHRPEPTAPPAIGPPSRPVSPWGFTASARKSLTAASWKQSADTGHGLNGRLSRRQSLDIEGGSVQGLSPIIAGGVNISRMSSRSGTSTPFQPLAPSTSPVQPSSLAGGYSVQGSGGSSAVGMNRLALGALDVAIMPMQRPPRYVLLLADLVKHTAPESESQKKVQQSLSVLRNVASKCDEVSAGRSPRQ